MNGFIAAMVAAAVAAADIPPEPPDTPQRGEVVIDGAHDSVAIGCARFSAKMRKRLHYTLHRVVVTKDPKWGTIWRADTSVSMGQDYPPMWWRTVCTKEAIVERPLDMFDHSKNIGRLK